MLEIDEHHDGGSLLSEHLMEKRTATCMTNRQAGLQEVSTDHQRRSGADRNVRLFPGQEVPDWLAADN